MDTFGRIFGCICGLLILNAFHKDLGRGERKTCFDVDWPKHPEITYYVVLLVDLAVGVSFFGVCLFGHGMFFGRSLCMLLGYGIFNFSISYVMNTDTDEEEGGAGCGCALLPLAVTIIIWGATQYVSWIEILEVFVDILDF